MPTNLAGQYYNFNQIANAPDSLLKDPLTNIPSVTMMNSNILDTIQSNPVSPVNLSSFDPSDIRMSKGDLIGKMQGATSAAQLGTTVTVQTGGVKNVEDWRIRVSLAEGSGKIFYKSGDPGILAPLVNTGGAIFPYTPQISMTHSARYADTKLTHSNYASYFYEGSEVSAITISGDFTAQTVEEGKYILAVVSFFRSMTKMFFGNQDNSKLAGSPPPILKLNGYGKYYFSDVPCVLTSFQHTLPGEVDYIEVAEAQNEIKRNTIQKGQTVVSSASIYSAGITRVPTNSQMSITLQPIFSRKRIHTDFNLENFANGSLLTTKGGFI